MGHHLTLLLHIISATVWVGGHILLCLRILPEALKAKDPSIVLQFEKRYEIIGIPSLLIQVITGVFLAYRYNVTIDKWFSFSNSIEKAVSLKLILLLLTIVLAVHARFFIIPRLRPGNLNMLAWHIILVTLIGITMLVIGYSFRIGGLL